MKYDFDKVHSRMNTNCAKWDAVKFLFGSEDVIPMWVADMDFPAARPIVEALKERAAHPFYGYSMNGKGLTEAVVNRVKKKYGWKIEPEWVVYTPGVVSALTAAVKALTRPGDEIILQEPVYYPFFTAVKTLRASLKKKAGCTAGPVAPGLSYYVILTTLSGGCGAEKTFLD